MEYLPHGFFDIKGHGAAERTAIVDAFQRTAQSFGYERFIPSPVGFESTFTSFGSESGERMFCFPDRKGRPLALTADSLVVAARTAASMVTKATQPVHLYGVVPIFRYRRARYRNWNHLIFSLFNQDDGAGSEVALPRALKALFERLQVPFSLDCCDYGIFDAVLAARGFDRATARHHLYEVRKRHANGSAGNLIAALLAGASPQTAIELSGGDRAVAKRLAEVDEIMDTLRACGVPAELTWRFDHAAEHHSGFSFLIRARAADGSAADIGDGGGFHGIVGSAFSNLRTAWSAALSLDLMADLGMGSAVSPLTVHMVRLDSSIMFFIQACEQVRASGLVVREYGTVRRIPSFIDGLPKERTSFVCLVGGREEDVRSVRIASVTKHTALRVTIDGQVTDALRDRLLQAAA